MSLEGITSTSDGERNESNNRPYFLQSIDKLRTAIRRRWRRIIDYAAPYMMLRWSITSFLLLLYLARIYFQGGWHVVTYGLGIYMLNLVVDFISPVDDLDEGVELPTSSNDDYKGFSRKLPEHEFWYSFTFAVLLCLLCTSFEFLNIPVFWPILLIYFIVLSFIQLKHRGQHMYRHGYLPFSKRKPKFTQ